MLSYVIEVRARDPKGAEVVGVFEVSILDLDDERPVITLLGNDNLTHEAGFEYIDLGASWTDNVDGTGIPTKRGNVDVLLPGNYSVIFNHTDAAGNAAQEVTRTVTVVDTTAPVIFLNGDNYLSHEAGEEYIDQNATWTDIVDGSGVVLAEGQVDTTMPGTYVLSYNYTDQAGNVATAIMRTLTVVDTTAPTIVLNGDSQVILEAGNDYIDAGASWADLVDGEGVPGATGQVDVMVPGIYTITYNHTDYAGNEAIPVARSIEVVDTTVPVITLNGDDYLTHEAGEEYIDANATWADLVDGSGVVLAEGQVDTSIPGIYVLSYNYIDSSGNAAQEVTRTVTVVYNGSGHFPDRR